MKRTLHRILAATMTVCLLLTSVVTGIPFATGVSAEDSATVTPTKLYTAENMLSTAVDFIGGTMAVETDTDGSAYVRATSTSTDPWFIFNGTHSAYVVFRYRTNTTTRGEIYTSGAYTAPTGPEMFYIDYSNDGEWHTTVLNVAAWSQTNVTAGTVNYFRLGLGRLNDIYMDIAYAAFFDSLADAKAYAAQEADANEEVYVPTEIGSTRVEAERSANNSSNYHSPHDSFSNGLTLYVSASVADNPTFTYEFTVDAAGEYSITAASMYVAQYTDDFTTDYTITVDGTKTWNSGNGTSVGAVGNTGGEAMHKYHLGTVYLSAGTHTAVLAFDLEDAAADARQAIYNRIDYFEFAQVPHNCTCTVETVDAAHLASEATCTEPAKYYKSCTDCGRISSTKTFENGEALNHAYSTEWSHDEANHWHACTREGCTEVAAKTAHSGGTAGHNLRAVCEVCGVAYGDWTVEYDAKALASWGVGSIEKTTATDASGTYLRLDAPTGDDNNICSDASFGKAGQYAVLRYRSNSTKHGAVYTSGTLTGPSGAEVFSIEYIGDEQWHTVLLDLSQYAQCGVTAGTVNYFRFDPDLPVGSSTYFDLSYIAFFNSADLAWAYAESHAEKYEDIYTDASITVEGESCISYSNPDITYVEAMPASFSGSAVVTAWQESLTATTAPTLTYSFEVATAGSYSVTVASYILGQGYTSDAILSIDGVYTASEDKIVTMTAASPYPEDPNYRVYTFQTLYLTAGTHTAVITMGQDSTDNQEGRILTKVDYFRLDRTQHACTYTEEAADAEYLASNATCTEAATYYKSCVCGRHGSETFVSGAALDHAYSTEWSHDEANHWHACTREGCTEVAKKTAHSGGTATTTSQAVCDVCNRPYGNYAAAEEGATITYRGVQTTDMTAAESFSIRFVATVDSTDYGRVGFTVKETTYRKSWTLDSDTVYSTLNGSVGTTYTAEKLGGRYITALTITDVPVGESLSFEVTPYTTASGVNTYGETWIVTITAEGVVSHAKAE